MRGKTTTFGELLLRLSPAGHERLLQSPTLSASFGGAAESVTDAKRNRLVAAASLYLAGLRREANCRFDVLLLDDLQHAHIRWIRNAFSA